MRSTCEILWEIQDGKINTREDAANLMNDEVKNYAAMLHCTEDGARALLIRALTRVYPRATTTQQNILRDLFDIQGESFIDRNSDDNQEIPMP